MFAEDDPYTGIDLDDAIDSDIGQLKPWAKAIVDRLNSYTEISPSGTGVKIWIKAKKPSNARCRIKHGDGEVELYDRGRYFAVTGQHWSGTPTTIEERQAEVEAFYQQLFTKDDHKGTRQGARRLQAETRPLADVELIEKAKAAKNGDKFGRLPEGFKVTLSASSGAKECNATGLHGRLAAVRLAVQSLENHADVRQDRCGGQVGVPPGGPVAPGISA